MDNPVAILPFPVIMSNRIRLERAKVVLDRRPGEEATSISAITEIDSNFGPVEKGTLASSIFIKMQLTCA